MSKEKLRNKGITLIALIITIIVMLIITGVVLSVALGDNGIVNYTKEAKIKTQIEIDREKLLDAVAGAIGIDGKVNFTYLDNNLPAGFTGSDGTYVSPNMNKFTVSPDGKITYVGKEEVIEEVVGDVTVDLELLQRYFLGKYVYSLIANLDDELESEADCRFINNDIIENAYDKIRIYAIADNEWYIKYNVNKYKLTIGYNEDEDMRYFAAVEVVQTSEVDLDYIGKYYVINSEDNEYVELYDDGTYVDSCNEVKGEYFIDGLEQKINFIAYYYVDIGTNEIIEELPYGERIFI